MPVRRVVRRLAGGAILMGVALSASGCGFLKRYWYQAVPVDNALGDSVTALGGRQVHVHRDGGLEVYAANANGVTVGWEQLRTAIRGYERMFASRAPAIALVLSDEKNNVSGADSAGFAARQLMLVVYERTPEMRSLSSRIQKYSRDRVDELWPAGPQLTRALLAHWVRLASVGEVRGVRDAELLDRLPPWYRDAVTGLISDPATAEDATINADSHRGEMMPLAALLARSRPAVEDTIAPRGSQRQREQVLRDQAMTLGLFLAERAGVRVMGEIGEALLQGKSLEAVLASEQRLPHSLDELERVWKEWLKERAR